METSLFYNCFQENEMHMYESIKTIYGVPGKTKCDGIGQNTETDQRRWKQNHEGCPSFYVAAFHSF